MAQLRSSEVAKRRPVTAPGHPLIEPGKGRSHWLFLRRSQPAAGVPAAPAATALHRALSSRMVLRCSPTVQSIVAGPRLRRRRQLPASRSDLGVPGQRWSSRR